MNVRAMEATSDRVVRYLVENYEIDANGARALCEAPEAKEQIDTAKRLGSYSYYPGDKIAGAASLVERKCAACGEFVSECICETDDEGNE